MTLKDDIAIFKLKPLVTNFEAKLSAVTEENENRQILVLVHKNNDIFFRYTNYGSGTGPELVVRLLPWFNERGRVIQDICFDFSNKWLLVLCDDNTLHVVPALAILSKGLEDAGNTITSYIIPFVGPHECPNPRTCPNNFYKPPASIELEKALLNLSGAEKDQRRTTLDELYSKQRIDKLLSTYELPSTYFADSDLPNSAEEQERKEGACLDDKITITEFVKDTGKFVCPFPTSVVWWQTKKSQNRAIVGYSDGSICFLSLTPNCPFIASTSIPEGSVQKLDICKDSTGLTSTLLIQSSKRTQWKLLLEEETAKYIFPGESSDKDSSSPESKRNPKSNKTPKKRKRKIDQDWEIVVPLADPKSVPAISVENADQSGIIETIPRLFPTTRAGLSYLRGIATQKIESVRPQKTQDDSEDGEIVDLFEDESQEEMMGFDCLESPSVIPEIITTASGPTIFVPNHNKRAFLFALHKYTDTVSVHNLNMDAKPIYIFRLPPNCENVLLTHHNIFSIQQVKLSKRSSKESEEESEAAAEEDSSETVNACGVISKSLAIKNNDSEIFEDKALVTYFPFPNEKILNIHGYFIAPERRSSATSSQRDELSPPRVSNRNELSVREYVKTRGQYESGGDLSESTAELKIVDNVFPRIDFEQCFVVTERNTFVVELSDKPEAIFMNFAKQSMWSSCKYFCDIFNVSMAQCIEYVGDELLKQRKVTQALMTYNVAQIAPIKMALKLATYGESNALLNLSAMALKCIYVLKSTRPTGMHMKDLLKDSQLRHRPQKGPGELKQKQPSDDDLNSGFLCSDFCYSNDDAGMDIQMSFSSQFHLSNLLLLTLCERTITDKNYIPLWNYLNLNQKFHTNLASTILAQSGLYSTTILLAKVRGAALDVFLSLTKAIPQEFGTDINYLFYNLSDVMFRECITYLSLVSIDFFRGIKSSSQRLSILVLDRLVPQLNPFDISYRPIVSRLAALKQVQLMDDETDEMFANFCRYYIEAFLAVIIRCAEMNPDSRSNVLNALTNINIRHESSQIPIQVKQSSFLAAGYAHSCRIIAGCAYVWGSNIIPYAVDNNFIATTVIDSNSLSKGPKMVSFLSNLNITVISVHCGRTHTLLLTNNGLYAMGANHLGQLGVGNHISQSLHPILVRELKDKSISLAATGQYHNAVVADGDLYTWGWGVYGQLGNGSIEDVQVPQRVRFFNNKTIEQLALGHVHTMVLCQSEQDRTIKDLFLFGSNYFGQLGVGQNYKCEEKGSFIKSLVPIRLDLGENIKFIHTKFFVSFAVTESNTLLTWGSSPQALRIINQSRKRARSQIRSERAKAANAANLEASSSKSPDNEVERGVRPESLRGRRNSAPSMDRMRLKMNKRNEVLPVRRSPSEECVRNLENIPQHQKIPETKIEDKSEEGGEGKETVEKEEVPDLEEWTEHLMPVAVDTSFVESEILQVASGLYHFALRTKSGALFTWGKNIEKQLGNEGSRADVLIPTHVETLVNVSGIDCGADFTLVLTNKGENLFAFGNNNQGQCGQDSNEKSALMGKWVRLKISKRHIRIPDGSACVHAPTEVIFPEPAPVSDSHRMIKGLPQFKMKFFSKSPYLSKTCTESNMSSLEEGMSNLGLDFSKRYSESSTDFSPDECGEGRSATETEGKDNNLPRRITPDFVHFCLSLFNGIYDVEEVAKCCNFAEFLVRLRVLDLKFFEAFQLCLSDLAEEANLDGEEKAQKAIVLFEYFTKDENLIPMPEEDLKYFVQEICVKFIDLKWNMTLLEDYFVRELNQYIVPLAYTLFFDEYKPPGLDGMTSSSNSNGKQLRESVLLKYRPFFSNLERNSGKYFIPGSDQIFDNVSNTFNAIICQRVIELFDEIHQS